MYLSDRVLTYEINILSLNIWNTKYYSQYQPQVTQHFDMAQ